MHDLDHPARGTDAPPEPKESADPRRWKVLAVVSLAQFMLILDVTVVNVALPDLGAALGLGRKAFIRAVHGHVLIARVGDRTRCAADPARRRRAARRPGPTRSASWVQYSQTQ
jgi:hypothetical protein